MPTNPNALYVNCDGAMDYNGNNPGGIGYVMTFPDKAEIEPISISKGIYANGNIEQTPIRNLQFRIPIVGFVIRLKRTNIIFQI